MPQISKRKAQLQQISLLRNENKRRKLDHDTKTKSALLAQIRDEDFWDEYESFNSESSSDESSSDQFSTSESESEKESCLGNVEVGEKSKETEDKSQQMMGLKWTTSAGAYLRGTRGCGSASTDKRRIRHRRELEAEASKCKSIPEMFGIQRQKIPVKEKTAAEIRIQASRDLDDLLQHKTKQITSKSIIKM